MLNKASIEGLRKFLEHAATLKPQNNPKRENGFAKEFQEIKETSSRRKKDPFFSTHHGEKDINRPKNRYKDIMPYDYSRIILPAIEGKEGSDYINGNYIKGPTDEVLYLAVQGPLPITVNDFWRMIISHQTQVIVMACREYELGKLKCKRYWPEKLDEKLTFDACKVSLISQEEMGDGFVIRTLSAKHANGELKVTQFHYTAWPDHDVPRSATPLIELTMSFRAFVGNDNNVPVLVHCSAGCGRTGTICALDYALSLIKLGRTESYSVFDIVSNLRQQRIAMVQTKEQYELVYKAVKDIVSNELLKQRTSMHTYVNVSVGEDVPETENTYENVDFIRSIQRLHEEEKNAARKPKELPSPSKEVVAGSKKDIVLAPQKNNVPRHDVSRDRLNDKKQPNKLKCEILANQKPEQKGNVANDIQQQPAAKPPIKRKPPQSGYENVLPLSAANAVAKPPFVSKPQNYVNLVIGTQESNLKNDDYVNVPSSLTKSLPDPEKIENVNKSSKPVTVQPVQTKPVPPYRSYQKVASVNGDVKDDYVVLPIKKKDENNSDCVILPSLSATADKRPLDQGTLVGLGDSEPTSLPKFRRRSSDHEEREFKSLDASLVADLSRSSPSLQTPDSDKHPLNQPKTSGRLSTAGQYSLIGALDAGSPYRSVVTDPFENTPNAKGIVKLKEKSALGVVEPVVADAEPAKLENPVPVPRRASEATLVKCFVNQTNLQEMLNATHALPQANEVVGSYSMVNLPKIKTQNQEKTELLIDFYDEKVGESSKDNFQRRFQKSHSTENIISCKPDLYPSVQKSGKTLLRKQPGLDSSITDNSSISDVPFTRRKSEDVLSSAKSRLYDMELPQKAAINDLSVEEKKESQDVLGNGLVRKKPVGVRRSNSNVTTPSADFIVRDEVDSLYATVGAKTKDKRKPKASEIFANGNSPAPSSERRMNRSDNSTSSLRSTTSISSSDSWEDAPPVPLKTADALLSLDEEDPYEAVQRSSPKSTLNRIKFKARNIIPSGAHVSKLSLGRKNISSTDSLGRGQDSISEKGFRTHVGKPQGPRECPNHWPKFSK